ncbi:MAG: hypothetical protein HC888_02335 [Candidatus Competibacteraceae bacterium]|nr:hypothetical protein [Candidatus Competibacteraceae bacterium]
MRKVSDFKLAAAAIRRACKQGGVPFVDVNIEFAEPAGYLKNGVLIVPPPNTLQEVLTNILVAYLANDEKIVGKALFDNPEQRRLFLMHSAALYDHAAGYSPSFSEARRKQLTPMRLYQLGFVWTLVRDLICPMYEQAAKNVRVLAGEMPTADFALYYDRVEQSEKGEEPFIFVNHRCDNEPVVQAHLLVEAIRAQDLDPTEVIRTIMSSSVSSKLVGFANLLFSDEEADEFIAVVLMVVDLEPSDFPHLVKASAYTMPIKTSQWYDSPGHSQNPNWWYFGLYEKMLEPVRGSDWSVYESLEHWITDFWKQVEKIEEKKPQGEGVPFNALLRLKAYDTTEEKADPRQTLQKLIGKHRVLE